MNIEKALRMSKFMNFLKKFLRFFQLCSSKVQILFLRSETFNAALPESVFSQSNFKLNSAILNFHNLKAAAVAEFGNVEKTI